PAWNASHESVNPGSSTFTSTPRAAAALRAMIVLGSGTKYATDMWMLRSAYASAAISVRYIGLILPSGDEPITDMTMSPCAAGAGYGLRASSARQLCFSHVDRNSFCSSGTAGPSTRTWVSRQPSSSVGIERLPSPDPLM